MSYVIYNKETTYYMPGMKRGGYASKGAATRALNKTVADNNRKVAITAVWEKYYCAETMSYDEAMLKTMNECDILSDELYRATNGVAKAMDKDDYAIADATDFHDNIEKMVTRVNLMSQKEFEERANTPIYCSPAFESYWSM
jgi:hypothetical protein